MERRQFIKASVGGAVAVGLAGAGVIWLTSDSNTGPLTIDAALAKLELLSDTPVVGSGAWSPYQVFTHCAQSVEFSMSGFPEHKPAIFKNTVGKLAFSAFSSRGKMTHGLSEPIPGAPALTLDEDVKISLARLKTSMVLFKQYHGNLSPHFAYGQLSKRDYEIAHVLHLYNHLEQINS